MTDTALITKYRPANLDEVIGQDGVVKALMSVIKKKSAKSFLFVGPSGVGKTTLARIVADMVGVATNAIQEVDGATFSGIENVREITAGLQYRPIGGGKKAIIVDEAHALSKAAWQALLKIMEEPPEWCYFMLCTTESLKVPTTIVTRCAKFELKSVAVKVIAEFIAEVAEVEDYKCSGGVIDVCALNAGGSPRQALANLALCADITERKEAAELLKSAEQVSEAIELARLLIKGANWSQVQPLLLELKDINPESIRHVVRSYVTKVVLGAKTEKAAEIGLAILDAFSQPFNSSDSISPVVLAVGKLVF